MSSYEKMSTVELRKKLLEFGYDLPTSVEKDFMIKKLEKVAPNKHFLQGQPSSNTSMVNKVKPIQRILNGRKDFSRVTSEDTDSNMFGLIVPGRIVQVDFTRHQEIENEPSKFKIDIPNADMIDHVVVFLTGTEQFPLGKAGQIYFGWPDIMRNEITWHLLGHITNERPSAIFKIPELKKNLVNPGQLHHTMTSFTSQGQQGNSTMGHTAQIGISVEFLEVILDTYSPQMLL